ncbi:methyltransferase domain-containing protein [Micromonospora sp. STR1_7]|uniref:Methyltransferase domain-containing protein n=1 Tax=Micromonospora parastrephiae TaxID=2806101 RepID=A0ABS1XTI8_9ACTN|nr:class I SAM-dependent methyltransferase [Micromonospora parastrephiae]MBM0232581.1 methyltransferase domain-containing protein [Micromonospora parastrephiae]
MTEHSEFGPESYGERLAEIYDDWVVQLQDDTEQTVTFLADLSKQTASETGAGDLLELGVGTGRVALPLAAKGLSVTGVDASVQMLDLLAAKPGGQQIQRVLGDFTDVRVDRQFGVVYIVFNTLLSLPTQEDQVRCLRNAAEHLVRGGALVVQAFVPDVARFEAGRSSGQAMEVARKESTSLLLSVSNHDPVTQRMWPRYGLKGDSGVQEYPLQFRYVWPSELDLMARLAGLKPESRWGGWEGQEFTAESPWHVSVYRRVN